MKTVSDLSFKLHNLLRNKMSLYKWFGASILFLLLIRGGLYASLMPSWGLIDEQQHMHYVQHIVEYQTPPVVGKTYLSSQIIESIFSTQRWEKFHWSPPASQDPQQMGLEGHSYEGYQPPLFYVLLAPLYALLPEDMLIKLYAMRSACVVLSSLTVLVVYIITKTLVPEHPMLPYFVCLLLVMIPERTASVSRVNNDVLLEAIAAFFVLVCTWSILKGLSVRYSQLLGLLLGLGVLTKTSMATLAIFLPIVFLKDRHQPDWWKCIFWTGGIAGSLIVPFVVYNFFLYGDLTGFSGFRSLVGQTGVFAVPGLTWPALINEGADLFRHLWIVFWRGQLARKYALPNFFLTILALLSFIGVIGLVRYLSTVYRRQASNRLWVLVGYVLMIVMCAMMVMWVRFDGWVPSIQGRFLLPVIVPIVVLLGLGLWHSPGKKIWCLAIIVMLLVFDAVLLIGDLHFFYYASAFVGDPIRAAPYSWQAAWLLYCTRLLSDKPLAMHPVLYLITPIYVAVIGFVGYIGWKITHHSAKCDGMLR